MESAETARTVLLVDADPTFRSFLSGLLRPRAGLDVLEARGAWDVWPLLDEHAISLFVIDAAAPEAGGQALVEELRRRRIDTPILFVASEWQDHEAHGRLTTQLEVQRVMHKPFSAYQFIMEVESALEAPQATLHDSAPPPAKGSVPRRLVSEPMLPAFSEGTTFVVVGSNVEQLRALRTAAEHAVVSLVYAADGRGAAELNQQHRLDGALVLLDPSDPDSGFAEATELLCSEQTKALPVGFVSHDSSLTTRINAVHAGGTVHLTLPVSASDFRHAKDAMGVARRQFVPRVLVVATPSHGALLAHVLQKARMNVDAVTDALTLLDHLDVATPDLLLFDIDLPGVSGIDICKLLRASPSWRSLALVLLSANASSEARIAAFDAGADDFLVKPLTEEEFVARIEARVRRHRAVRESADKDPVTGLLQRHAFVDRSRAMLAAARRSAAVVAFCVLRVDGISPLRADTVTTERVMRQAGQKIAPLLREYDLRARWSEDELILALPDVDTMKAQQLFARLLRGLSSIELADDHGAPIALSFQAGIAAHPDDAHTIPSLVRTARKRLTPLKNAVPV